MLCVEGRIGVTITLDSEHRYWRPAGCLLASRVEVPGVTRILKDMGLTPPYPEDRGWLEFGTAVHRACELMLLDRLEIGEVGEYPGTDARLCRT